MLFGSLSKSGMCGLDLKPSPECLSIFSTNLTQAFVRQYTHRHIAAEASRMPGPYPE